MLYDAQCAFCRRCGGWLARQPAFVPLVFLPFQSPDVKSRFPEIERLHPADELVVISDDGAVWRGASAWVTILWALREFRGWSQRLASPLLLPFARQTCALISENRHVISKWFSQQTDEQLQQQLGAFAREPSPRPSCELARKESCSR